MLLPRAVAAAAAAAAAPLLLLLALSATVAVAAPDGHLVARLPGFRGALPSNHYSGYVTVDEARGRRLFYYLVESERDPTADPVVLWLNGGPGCSSFDGFVYENGPFGFGRAARPGGGGLPDLELNPYTWSKVSNMVYLDSPAGVGMSYSLNKSDYTTGDLKTAADAHTFLLKWFELYPEFQSNPFYISGESYAGIYIPTLADEVVKGIEKNLKPRINLKGYLIGNGATDHEHDFNSFVPFAHGMGLISSELFEGVSTACHGTFWGNVSELCQQKIDKVDWELKDLNKYNILAPCYHHPEIQELEFKNSSLPSSFRKLGETERRFPVRKRMAGRSWPLRAAITDGRMTMWPELGGRSLPCTSDELANAWLDDEDVRAAIHAEPKSLIGSWELYTARIDYYHDSGSSMVKYHKKFTAMGYRVLIYSGDHDLCIPYVGTEAWIRSMGYRVIDSWRPWYFGEQVAGYTEGYEHNLTFLTIKGAGHTVPEYKPKETLEFYTRWLSGEKI
ncbi:serine carboxypeptidase 1-like [Oryza brachyantha]|uniref:serine carboxypeptidase 1-like n=1 Tax=Oryza brachyantha TaxID=4533 RepID=UPI001ADBA90F|nr:serine carboxypeptidase 1-like [Oryza brachyantha]